MVHPRRQPSDPLKWTDSSDIGARIDICWALFDLFQGADSDYWSENFDTNRNCKQKDRINALREEVRSQDSVDMTIIFTGIQTRERRGFFRKPLL